MVRYGPELRPTVESDPSYKEWEKMVSRKAPDLVSVSMSGWPLGRMEGKGRKPDERQERHAVLRGFAVSSKGSI